MRRLNMEIMFALGIIACVFFSCDSFKDPIDYKMDEPVKELTGSWYLTKVTRNGLDITKSMNFSAFRISFKGDNTYTIDNYLPFPVRQDGTWNVNDFQYPTQLIFKQEAESYTTAFEYQTVEGERQITLSFSPGCHSNIYSYVLERVLNN